MSGARFILNTRYFHVAKPGEAISKYALNPEHISGLVHYVGTRESVELNISDERKTLPATEKQIEKIKEFTELLEKGGDCDYKEFLEYNDYLKAPTRQNASELISRLSEMIMFGNYSYDINGAANLVEYAAKRPGAVQFGEHGLFSSYDNVNLKQAMDEVSTHKGNIWTHILSLRREDADRLGYDTQAPWRNLVMAHIDDIAKEHQISVENIRWYAAMHNTGHHPHIHLFVYSSNPNEGFFSEKVNNSVSKLKSKFATDIFRDDLKYTYTQKHAYREELKTQTSQVLNELLSSDNAGFNRDKINSLAEKMLALSDKLPTSGRIVYGYQTKEIKAIVDDIQKSLINDNPCLSSLYQSWCRKQYNIEQLYINNPQPRPIETEKEFFSIKNEILRQANILKNGLPQSNTIDESTDNSDNKENTEITNYDNYFTLTNEQETNSKININNFIKPTSNIYDPIKYYLKSYPEQIFYSQEPENHEISDNLNLIYVSDKNDVKKFKALNILANNFETRNAEICQKLADCYNFGKGTEKDTVQAQMWYGIAADQYNDGMASYRLGQQYLYGSDNTEIDTELAEHYLKQAYIQFKDEIQNSEFFEDLESNSEPLSYFSKVPYDEAYKEYLIGRMYLKGEGLEQNYEKAFQTFLLAAENGYAHANYYIGNQYYYGLGFKQDYVQALHYYQKAYRKNDMYAAYRLGKMNLNGEGAEINVHKAADFFDKASESVPLANYNLAQLYEKNRSDFSDISDKYIHDLYRTALEKLIEQEKSSTHDAFTEMRIASMYLDGKGTDINVSEAVKWLEKSAEQSNPDAAYQLGYIYSSDKYNLADNEKSNTYYRTSLQGYEKAEKENQNSTAEYRIGLIYLEGRGVDSDINNAINWLNKATLNGNSNAAFKLAKIYEDELLDIPKNIEKAIIYYKISEELGNPYAAYQLGKISYAQGDFEEASKHFQKAAEKDIPHAWYKLGQIYSSEVHGLLNKAQAHVCYANALNQYIADYKENPDNFTSYRIGQMYLNAQGTEKNIAEAVSWFMKSNEQGNPDAAFQLGKIYYSDSEIPQDLLKAESYFKISAEAENPYASYYLGNINLEQNNLSEAIGRFEKAAEKNIPHALYKLGQIYSSEVLGLLDETQAHVCYANALNQYIADYKENPDAFTSYRIGQMYLNAQGTEKNIAEAVSWFIKSNEQGNPDAAYQLGYIYKSDEYGFKNDDLSNKYFSSALLTYETEFNNTPNGDLAMRIGTFYHYGSGIERDLEKAIEWYKKAVELGNTKAQQKIDEANNLRQLSIMSVATTACHFGRILNTETMAAAKNRIVSDSKLLRKEKVKKIYAGHAVNDNAQSFDY